MHVQCYKDNKREIYEKNLEIFKFGDESYMIDKLNQILNSFKRAEISGDEDNSIEGFNMRLEKINGLKTEAKKDLNLALFKLLEQEENEILNKKELFEQIDKS